MPSESVIGISDFILLHGNDLQNPDEVRQLVDRCLTSTAYGQPIVFNEDDHTEFDAPDNYMIVAIGKGGERPVFPPLKRAAAARCGEHLRAKRRTRCVQ